MRRRTVFQHMIKRFGFVLAVSLLIMLVSIVGLTVFYWVVEGDCGRKRSLFDIFYFTVITTRTIGFGDITPQTFLGKLGTIFNALLPASLFFGTSIVVLQSFFDWLEDSYRRYRMGNLSKHNVIVGDEESMESIVKEFALLKKSFICVSETPAEKLPPSLQQLLDATNYYCGDPTRDDVLSAVNIKEADSILISTPDDNVNLYVLVTARGLAPDVKTIVRVNRLEAESKFRSVGADMLMPAGTMLGMMLSKAATSPVAQELLVRLHTRTTEPYLNEANIEGDHSGMAVRSAFPTAISVCRHGSYRFDLEDIVLVDGDVVLYIGKEEASA